MFTTFALLQLDGIQWGNKLSQNTHFDIHLIAIKRMELKNNFLLVFQCFIRNTSRVFMNRTMERCRYAELHFHLTSLTWRPGGKDCFNFSAFSLSDTTSVYKKREQRILNLVFNGFFLILTARASFRRALIKKSFTSLISFGICWIDRILVLGPWPAFNVIKSHSFSYLHWLVFVKITKLYFWREIYAHLFDVYTFRKKEL